MSRYAHKRSPTPPSEDDVFDEFSTNEAMETGWGQTHRPLSTLDSEEMRRTGLGPGMIDPRIAPSYPMHTIQNHVVGTLQDGDEAEAPSSGLLLNQLGLGSRAHTISKSGEGRDRELFKGGISSWQCHTASAMPSKAAGGLDREPARGKRTQSFQRYDSGIGLDDSIAGIPTAPLRPIDLTGRNELASVAVRRRTYAPACKAPARDVNPIVIDHEFDEDDKMDIAVDELDESPVEDDQTTQVDKVATLDPASRIIEEDPSSPNDSDDDSDNFDYDDEFYSKPHVIAAMTKDFPGSSPAGAKVYPWKARLASGADVVRECNLVIEQDRTGKSCRVYRRFPPNRFLWAEIPKAHCNPGRKLDIDRWCGLVIRHLVCGGGSGKGNEAEEAIFTFLCSTESRLKSKTICFFAPYKDSATGTTITHHDVLRAFGDLESVYTEHGIGKYVARLSLSWSDTRESITLKPDQIVRIPDYYIGDDPSAKAYSDGCGIITLWAAMEIRERLEIDYLPSVFQIRLGGYKGLLAVWSDDDIERHLGNPWYRGSAAVYVRDSQYKYRADHLNVLEINSYSPPTCKPARLQRSFIRILCTLGVKVGDIEALLREELKRLDGFLADARSATKWLEAMGADIEVAAKDAKSRALLMLKAGHDVREPYVAHELQTLQRYAFQRLREKLAIPVPKSTILLGVIDETGSLLEGEIVAYIPRQGYLEGWVTVTRSPCSHPGDVRLMRAMKPMKGSPPKNCLVFPRTGAQPVPDQISGGDLDGDLYFVSWDDSLKIEKAHKPNPRHPRSPRPPVEHSVENIILDLKHHVFQQLTNTEIGKTSKAFEECEEISFAGAKDPNCLALSDRYEMALDATKAGYDLPRMPSRVPAGRRREDGPITHLQRCIPDPGTSRTALESCGPDPDLLYRRDSAAVLLEGGPELFERLRKEFSSASWKEMNRLRGGNKPVTLVPDTWGSEAPGLDEAKARIFSAFGENILTSMRAEHFPTAEFGDLLALTEKASCLYLVGYSLGAGSRSHAQGGLDPTTMKIAWLGAPYLNLLKSHRISERTGVAFACIATGSRKGTDLIPAAEEDQEESGRD